jgi:hypothetical protein
VRNQQRTAYPIAYSVDGAVTASDRTVSRSRLFLLIKSGAIDSRKEGRRRIISGPSYRRYLVTGPRS